jgi:hypothetical protein
MSTVTTDMGTAVVPKPPITIDLRPPDEQSGQSGPPDVLLPNFDPDRVAAEVAALESEAQAGKGVFNDRSAKIAAILWSIKQDHPEHLKSICERAGIGRSRRKQLLQIGSGVKTLEKSRAENRTRVQRHRAKAGAITGMAPPAEARADTQPSACDPEAPKMSDVTEEIELPMQDIDRLAKFKRRTVDREAVWVCEQLELAWSALRDRGRPLRPRT